MSKQTFWALTQLAEDIKNLRRDTSSYLSRGVESADTVSLDDVLKLIESYKIREEALRK